MLYVGRLGAAWRPFLEPFLEPNQNRQLKAEVAQPDRCLNLEPSLKRTQTQITKKKSDDVTQIKTGRTILRETLVRISLSCFFYCITGPSLSLSLSLSSLSCLHMIKRIFCYLEINTRKRCMGNSYRVLSYLHVMRMAFVDDWFALLHPPRAV